MMRLLIAMDLGTIQVHFWSTKTSKNLALVPHTFHVQPWHNLPSYTLIEDHLSWPHTIATYQPNLDCMQFQQLGS